MNAFSRALRRVTFSVCLCSAALLLFSPAPARAAYTQPAPLSRYADVLRSINPHYSLAASEDMATHLLLLSSYYGLDPRLLLAVVGVESHWHTHAVSRVGAQGLGQLMPATSGSLNVLAFDAYENLDGTARYLRRLLHQFSRFNEQTQDVRAIASYNAGPGAVTRAGGVPPFAETRTYVTRVMGLWRQLRTQLPNGAPAQLAIVRAAPQPSALQSWFLRLYGALQPVALI